MSCPCCADAVALGLPVAGRGDFACIGCMARLIASARPRKALQEAHIAAMKRFHGQEWPGMWAMVREKLAKAKEASK